MPNLVTHTLFAQDVLKDLNFRILNQNAHLFEIGSNGPDFLFFHKTPLTKAMEKTPLRKLGSKLHSGEVNAFYSSLLSTIRHEKNPGMRQEMIAYSCGHLCHWALDSTMHPYIFYRTGSCKGRSAWDHHRMESILDALMLKMKTGKTIVEYNVPEECANPTRSEMKVIARLYAPALNELYGEDIRPSMIAEALQDWHRMQKVFYDPKGRKVKALGALEKVSGMKNLMTGYAIPAKPEDNHDVFNLMHKEWKHPVTEEPSVASVLDLYEIALHKARRAIVLFLGACKDEEEEGKLLDFIDDDNYNLNTHTDFGMHCYAPEHFE